MAGDSRLAAFLAAVGILVGVTLVVRYLRERDGVFFDSSTYFVALMALYIIIPAVIHVQSGRTLVGAGMDTIRSYATYALYFTSVLALYYVVKGVMARRASGADAFEVRMPATSVGIDVIAVLYLLIVAYVMTAFVTTMPGVIALWSDRGAASDYKTALNAAFKIQFLYAIVMCIAVVLTLRHRNARYIWLLAPFVLMDIMTTDRSFLYQALMASIAMMLIARRKLPVGRLTLIALAIVSIEVIRAQWKYGIDAQSLLFLPGELLYTAESGLIVLDSDRAIAFPTALAFAIGKVFSTGLTTALLGSGVHFREILGAENTLTIGLGGSMLSEVFSYRSALISVLYPFIAIAYLELVNYLRRRGGLFGFLVFFYFMVLTVYMFRSGVIFAAGEPFYYAALAGAWYWILHMAFGRYRPHMIPREATA